MLPIPSSSEPDKPTNQGTLAGQNATRQAEINIENINDSIEKPCTLRAEAPEFIFPAALTPPLQEQMQAQKEQAQKKEVPWQEAGAWGGADLPYEQQAIFKADDARAYYPPIQEQQANPFINHPYWGLIYDPNMNLYRDPKTNYYFLLDPDSGLFQNMTSGYFYVYDSNNQLFFDPYSGQYLVPAMAKLNPSTSAAAYMGDGTKLNQTTPPLLQPSQGSMPNLALAPSRHQSSKRLPHRRLQRDFPHKTTLSHQEKANKSERLAKFEQLLKTQSMASRYYDNKEALDLLTKIKQHAHVYDKKLLEEEIERLSDYLDSYITNCHQWDLTTLATAVINLSSVAFFDPEINLHTADKRYSLLNQLVKILTPRMNWKDIYRRPTSVYIYLCLCMRNQTSISPEIQNYIQKYHEILIKQSAGKILNKEITLLGYMSFIMDKMDCNEYFNQIIPISLPKEVKIRTKEDEKFVIKSLYGLQFYIDNDVIIEPENSDIIHNFITQSVNQLNQHKVPLSNENAFKIIKCVARMGYLPQLPFESIKGILEQIDLKNLSEHCQIEMMLFFTLIITKYDVNNAISESDKEKFTDIVRQLYDITAQKTNVVNWEITLLNQIAAFLGKEYNVAYETDTAISPIQRKHQQKLQNALPELKILSEYQYKHLPPVDIALPELNILIEINGRHHYSFNDKNTPNAKTLLKQSLYRNLGFEVFTVNLLNNIQLEDEKFETLIQYIKQKANEQSLIKKVSDIKFS